MQTPVPTVSAFMVKFNRSYAKPRPADTYRCARRALAKSNHKLFLKAQATAKLRASS